MFYNPLDRFYKSITGAVSDAENVIFRVKGNFDSVILRVKKDGEDYFNYRMSRVKDYFEVSVNLSVGLYFYHFSVGNGMCIGLGSDYLGEVSDNPKDFQITSYSSEYTVPESFYGGIIYQIFPDRFFRSCDDKTVESGKVYHSNWNDLPNFLPVNGRVLNNDFFGGDLKGITEKLDYLKDLGVSVIYLNPIFKAYSNHRYDTGDYMQIDTLLGTEKDFSDLISCAKQKGINIILDGVFNHTGSDSVYFNKYGNYRSVGAYQSKNSPYYGWFNFTDYPNTYESWWGIDTLPAVNETNQDFINFITGENGVIEKYTRLGVGGWRLDVVDELPDFFVEKIRNAVKRNNKDAIVIGEVWEDATNKISYSKRRRYFCGNELDSVMNYPLKNAITNYIKTGSVYNLSYTIKEQIDHYPKKSLDALMNILSTHDTFRLLSAVADKDVSDLTKTQMSKTSLSKEEYETALKRVKIATLLQFTLCGIPSIYYGDEIGMQGYSDPLNRQTYKWDDVNTEILEWYKFLCKLRTDYSAFEKGEYTELFADSGCIVYKRADDISEILVAVNTGDKEICLEFSGKLKNLIDGKKYKDGVILNPKDVGVYICCK